MTKPLPSVLLEMAVGSVEDAVAAQAGGAQRLELNTALTLGGLTPSLGTFLEVKRAVKLPVMVMVRPRRGGFCYSDAEFRTMRRDVDLFLEHGADGIVFGVLNAGGTIDAKRCREVVNQIEDRQPVFHRAFDVTPEPLAALQQLIDLGVARVMTSGQEASALQGAALIAELIRQAAGRIEVLPAGGVNRLTVLDLLEKTGCNQVHAGLRTQKADRSTAARPQVSFGAAGQPPEDHFDATDADAVAALSSLLSPSQTR
jgi:copper homeostasis protein